MRDTKRILIWIVMSGLFVMTTTFFYNQFGIAQLIVILVIFFFSVALYWITNFVSTKIDKYADSKTKEDIEKLTSKRVFWLKFWVGCVFAAAFLNPLMIIFTVIHELGHAITGIISGGNVLRIWIVSPGIGFTQFATELICPLFIIMGSVSSILVSLVLFGLMYKSETIKLEVYIAVFLSIWVNILENVRYWHDSALGMPGDALSFLSYFSHLNPVWLAHFCFVFQIVMIVFLSCLFFLKLARFALKYFPNTTFGPFNRVIKKNY